MAERIDTSKVNPGAYRAMFGLEKYVHESGLELLCSTRANRSVRCWGRLRLAARGRLRAPLRR
ncbi:MAG: hypothetical protein ACJ8AG_04395 [Ktedonobacteraceae bacterium]